MTSQAETFSPWEYVRDEMESRGWDDRRLAIAMGGDVATNLAVLDFMKIEDRRLKMDDATAEGLAKAFGTTANLWLRLDKAWRNHGKGEVTQ